MKDRTANEQFVGIRIWDGGIFLSNFVDSESTVMEFIPFQTTQERRKLFVQEKSFQQVFDLMGNTL